ncbi:MAG: hypothetical protein IH973_09590 [Myxococcales bacterium]|nr:hypothetical protein [Myxococcales bacterium]
MCLDGEHRTYLGRYGSPESKVEYHRLLAEWSAGSRRAPVKPAELMMVELMDRFWKHAESYYRRADGTQTDELGNFKLAFRPLKELYARTAVDDFGPLKLKAVRQQMVDAGWCRSYINKQVSRLKLVFKWGVENELVSPTIWHGLQAVTGLRRGRTEARAPRPRPGRLPHVLPCSRSTRGAAVCRRMGQAPRVRG